MASEGQRWNFLNVDLYLEGPALQTLLDAWGEDMLILHQETYEDHAAASLELPGPAGETADETPSKERTVASIDDRYQQEEEQAGADEAENDDTRRVEAAADEAGAGDVSQKQTEAEPITDERHVDVTSKGDESAPVADEDAKRHVQSQSDDESASGDDDNSSSSSSGSSSSSSSDDDSDDDDAPSSRGDERRSSRQSDKESDRNDTMEDVSQIPVPAPE